MKLFRIRPLVIVVTPDLWEHGSHVAGESFGTCQELPSPTAVDAINVTVHGWRFMMDPYRQRRNVRWMSRIAMKPKSVYMFIVKFWD